MAIKDEDRCEALTILTEWKMRQKVTDLQCQFVSKLMVGEKQLCYRHGLMEALAILIREGKAIPIIQPQRYSTVRTIKERT